MPKNAILDPDVLIDDLVTDVIDGLRADLHPIFGTRAYDVSLVTRVWEASVGDGVFTDTEELMSPPPRVIIWKDSDQLGHTMEECGLDEAGTIVLKEVSLAYTNNDLLACEAPTGTEHLIKIVDGHGQGSPIRYFVHDKPPYVDRELDMGWVLWLRHTETFCL